MAKEISNKRKSYTLIAICFFVYVFAQITKSAMSANTTALMAEYNETHASLGLITSLFMIGYGFGQIIFSFVCTKFNKKITIAVALSISMITSLIAFFPIPFWLYYVIWTINGISHAPLWILLLLELNQKLSKKYMLDASFFMTIASLAGSLLSYVICSLFSKINFYKGSFLTAGVCLFLSLLIWIIYNLKDHNIVKDEVSEEDSKKVVKDNEFEGSFSKSIFLLIFFSIVSALACGISAGLKSWVPNMMKEIYNLEDWFSILISLVLPLCAVFNATLSIRTYKKVKNLNIVSIIYLFIAVILTIALFFLLNVHWALALLLLILITVCGGVVTCSLTVELPLCLANNKLNSGLIAGITNGVSYLGSAATTLILGFIADSSSSWNGVFIFFIVISSTALLMTVIYQAINIVFNKRKTTK